jgi:hypothetical protein
MAGCTSDSDTVKYPQSCRVTLSTCQKLSLKLATKICISMSNTAVLYHRVSHDDAYGTPLKTNSRGVSLFVPNVRGAGHDAAMAQFQGKCFTSQDPTGGHPHLVLCWDRDFPTGAPVAHHVLLTCNQDVPRSLFANVAVAAGPHWSVCASTEPADYHDYKDDYKDGNPYVDGAVMLLEAASEAFRVDLPTMSLLCVEWCYNLCAAVDTYFNAQTPFRIVEYKRMAEMMVVGYQHLTKGGKYVIPLLTDVYGMALSRAYPSSCTIMGASLSLGTNSSVSSFPDLQTFDSGFLRLLMNNDEDLLMYINETITADSDNLPILPPNSPEYNQVQLSRLRPGFALTGEERVQQCIDMSSFMSKSATCPRRHHYLSIERSKRSLLLHQRFWHTVSAMRVERGW